MGAQSAAPLSHPSNCTIHAPFTEHTSAVRHQTGLTCGFSSPQTARSQRISARAPCGRCCPMRARRSITRLRSGRMEPMRWRQPTGTFCRRGHRSSSKFEWSTPAERSSMRVRSARAAFVDGVRRTRSSSATSNSEKGEHRLVEGGDQIGLSVSSATFR
jgi:hypothetical protein